MDIKQTNVLLLLGKIKELLGDLPEEAKKGEKFLEAEKALEKLNELLAGKEGEKSLQACLGKRPAFG
jgi:hypothetical protein